MLYLRCQTLQFYFFTMQQANADFLFANYLFLFSFENSFVFRYGHEPSARRPLQPGRGLVPGWLQHLSQQQPW
jgi:hypothetical protein